MLTFIRSLNTTIGRKVIMAFSGLGLALFVMSHMLGNLLIFVGPETYNTYGYKLTSNPLYPAIAIGLLVCTGLHAVMGAWLSKQNREARGGTAYAVSPVAAGKEVNPASKSMMFSGTILLTFFITHLFNFKYGANYPVNYGGVEMRDLHRLVLEKFQSPVYVGGYIISLVVLGVHLSHGVSSVFQSLGLNHPKYTPAIKIAGVAYATIVAVGFISQPLYVFFFHRG